MSIKKKFVERCSKTLTIMCASVSKSMIYWNAIDQGTQFLIEDSLDRAHNVK